MVGVRDSIMVVVATVWRSSRRNLEKSFRGGVELDGGLLESDGSLRLEVSVPDLAACTIGMRIGMMSGSQQAKFKISTMGMTSIFNLLKM